jgi:digeranylgeranylglycerophospholipid reductase
MKFDVVVVGAGPAGCVTAKYAALSGATVLIVERDEEIGVPVLCGEGISKKVDDLGIIKKGRWVENEVEGARIFSPNGTMVKLSTEIAGNEAGYVIDRSLFDKELAREAIKAGAEIMLKTEATGLLFENGRIKGIKAKHMDKEIDIYADIVVGADGVESKIGKYAGIDTTLKPKDIVTSAEYTMAGIECDKEYCDFYVGKSIAPGGYIWVFPKDGDIANIGIGILGCYSEPGLASKLLNDFINKHPEYKKGNAVRMIAGAVPVSEPVETVRDNLILVGDAARHTDPLTGGGIMHALIAGRIAGKVIGEAVEKKSFAKETLYKYEDEWKKEFGKKLHRNYIMKEAASKFDDKTFDKLADSVKDLKFDEFSTRGLVKALVLKHPSLLMKLKPLVKAR